jgi:hypothetical protein
VPEAYPTQRIAEPRPFAHFQTKASMGSRSNQRGGATTCESRPGHDSKSQRRLTSLSTRSKLNIRGYAAYHSPDVRSWTKLRPQVLHRKCTKGLPRDLERTSFV